ncbi:uncharacterized protein LAESUDRAFT_357238 [Laetiporus sulphureus 93-53]|uniref:Uncharacterized protein n=1 Tax=Laetiporus sulphureus 93-53 TaxID=1314785 RepID=A0A165GWZ3_9APHY|nr:uncharacterized protein LAESUDRAFT_357238 [Laetiporus sulphureus 93-53]KZT10941.1 hypothetical protein LAESUDRAFT_357238 [Laetiporus sulphureus 93-53]
MHYLPVSFLWLRTNHDHDHRPAFAGSSTHFTVHTRKFSFVFSIHCPCRSFIAVVRSMLPSDEGVRDLLLL